MFKKLFHKDIYIPDEAIEEGMYIQTTMNKHFYSSHFIDHLQNNPVNDHKHKYLGELVEECLKSLVNKPQEIFELEYGKSFQELGVYGFHTKNMC